ncbi:MAG: hypothetical protein ABJD07_05395 [Gemmatimonadaceae bacterium]
MDEQSSTGTGEAPSAPVPARTGVMVGILAAALIALAVYFYWHATQVRDANGRRPAPAAIETK